MKKSVFTHVLLSAVAVILTACGGKTTTIVTTPPPTPTISANPGTITSGQATVVTWNAGGTATSASVSGSGLATSTALTGNASVAPGVTETYTITATNAGGSASASVTVTVNSATAVTSVSLACTPTELNNVQTTSCTPMVTGTGSFTNTVNLSMNPASAGTLSASQNVTSGTTVVFNPTFTTGTQTPTITATSTADSTKSSAVQLTVSLRTISINSPTGNIWLPNCAGIVIFDTAQTGMVNGDTIHADPYPSSPYTVTPPSTLPLSLAIGNDPGIAGACSPGAYDEYATGTDGARSNEQYIPILSPFNTWAGYNSTDEFQADYAKGITWKFKLSDGSADGSVPVVGLVTIVDGNNLLYDNPGSGGISVNDATTGRGTNAIGPSDGSKIVDFAAKNGIVAFTTTEPEVGFSMESFYTANALPNVGTAPSAIVGSTGCNLNANAASFFSYDNTGSILYRSDIVGDTSSGAITSASVVNNLALSGFSPVSELPKNLPRYVVAWDNTCTVAVLAPGLTGGINPDGTPAYQMEFALVDMTSGNAHQIGTYVTGIPSTAIRMAADPSGNDVVIASTNQAAGTTVLTKLAWTLDANKNPTFTVNTLGSAPPTGVYGVSLGILPSNLVPNGTVIRVGQRGQQSALANQ